MGWDSKTIGVFLAAVQTGSLGQCARKLNMTQPAVTRILRRLEDDLGVPLFDRTPTGVVPTSYGAALLPYAALVTSEMDSARKLMDLMRGASKGVVRVGGVGSVSATYIVPAIHRLRASAPALQVQIVEEIEDKLLESLLRGDIDIAVSPETYADERIALACDDSLSDRVCVYAAPTHPLAGRRSLTLEDSAAAHWALPPTDTPVTREWRRRHLVAGLEVDMPAVVSRSVNTIKSMTLLGDVLCWMPRNLVRDEVEHGQLVPIDIPAMMWHRSFHIYRRRQGHLPPPARLLVTALQDIARANRTDDHGLPP